MVLIFCRLLSDYVDGVTIQWRCSVPCWLLNTGGGRYHTAPHEWNHCSCAYRSIHCDHTIVQRWLLYSSWRWSGHFGVCSLYMYLENATACVLGCPIVCDWIGTLLILCVTEMCDWIGTLLILCVTGMWLDWHITYCVWLECVSGLAHYLLCVTGLAQYLLRVTGLALYVLCDWIGTLLCDWIDTLLCVTGLALYVLCDWIGTLLCNWIDTLPCLTGLVVIVCDYRHCVTGLVVIVTIGTVSLDW